ncbi:cell adhesion molecule CEACAM3-like [Equus przewalskii]|uniref:Cell adhesion molecule CEACAM3-like n=1 Tax=Equus przewalskii TaxID=9798 RepID=A0ABM2FMV6_EQUPR|nr:PREDICTED: carcinoembryonic antigen-related cell adhesion molecule 3-like isoform X1 [Equus przewalskii]
MQSPSGPAHRGCVPWQALLLAVSILAFWNLPATVQFTIESVPNNVTEGKDVLLLVHNLTGNILGYMWFKGNGARPHKQIKFYDVDTKAFSTGPLATGRETMYPNGSLLFQNVTTEYAGNYTLLVLKRSLIYEVGTGQVHVYNPGSNTSIGITVIHKDPSYRA